MQTYQDNMDAILEMTRQRNPVIGNFELVSQDPQVISETNRRISASLYLPAFIAAWKDIERVTGYAWRNTSYIRDSPSHKLGQAFDLAPDIADSARHLYAVEHNSDPVLYKREPLIRALQTLKRVRYGPFSMGAFIEPDHIHLQVTKRNSGEAAPFYVVKWKIPKPIYPDTYERLKLPMFKA